MWKLNPFYKSAKSILISLPSPLKINYAWNFGSILLVMLSMQMVSGLFLAMNYVGSESSAFYSVDLMSRDLWSGWFIRSVHSKGASFFFLFMYLHMGRGIYYNSFFHQATWIMGVLILMISMAVAFLGYVLPWGQMSFWAATVITKFVSSIPYMGNTVLIWLWGGYSVGSSTLTRFFALHYVLPFVMMVLVLAHKVFLHEEGSNSPISNSPKGDKLKFHSFYSWKDVLGFFLFFLVFSVLVLLFMKMFFDPEKSMEAKALVTPIHIQPEWYFLAAYAVLRSVPKKLGGVMGLVLTISIYFLLVLNNNNNNLSFCKSFFYQVIFWLWSVNFFLLSWMGSKPVEAPFSNLGILFSLIYFSFFFMFFNV